MSRLEGKVAVIPGGSSGIGAAAARKMASEGASVVIMARGERGLESVAATIRETGGKITTMTGDVTVTDDCERLMKLAVDTYGSLDILVNSAGIHDFHRPTLMADNELWDNCVAVNQTGVFYCSRAALRHMEKQGSGVIIMISSIGGVYSNCGASFSASKAAVNGLAKNIAIQYAGTGIRCNALCPGPTLRDPVYDEIPEGIAHDGLFDSQFMEITSRHTDTTIKPGELADQVNIIMFLAGDESKAINGQIIVSDFGACL